MKEYMPIILNEKLRDESDFPDHFVEEALFILNLLETDIRKYNISMYFVYWEKIGEKGFFRKLNVENFFNQKHIFYLTSINSYRSKESHLPQNYLAISNKTLNYAKKK